MVKAIGKQCCGSGAGSRSARIRNILRDPYPELYWNLKSDQIGSSSETLLETGKTYRGPALCGIAQDHGPALCHISHAEYIFVYFSANSKQKSKFFQGLIWGLLTIDEKTEGRKSRDTVSLS
jgi:hypothetical protein